MIATTRCKGGREQVREYLIEAREKAGLTQQDVANRIGISRQYYQMVETGERQKRMDLSLAGGLSVVLNTRRMLTGCGWESTITMSLCSAFTV